MKIAKGVEAFELPGNLGTLIYPTLVWDDDAAVLVDTGYPGQVSEIVKGMVNVGIPLNKLDKVIVTHQDYDHIGGLHEMVRLSGGKIEVLAHREEKPYIEGEKPLIKMTPQRLEQMFGSLPAEERKGAEQALLESLKANVDKAVEDGEVLPYCGGITVIHTPGHSPGHVCLYLNRYKTLLTGDGLNLTNGQLVGPNPVFTPDMSMAVESLRKLTQYDIETVICYHGGVCNDNVNRRLMDLAKE